jgi:hypothetical protein
MDMADFSIVEPSDIVGEGAGTMVARILWREVNSSDLGCVDDITGKRGQLTIAAQRIEGFIEREGDTEMRKYQRLREKLYVKRS